MRKGVIFDTNKRLSPNEDINVDKTKNKISDVKKDRVLTKETTQLLREFLKQKKLLEKNTTPIHVDDIASRIAKYYETIRKVVDWQEDNVLRRAAIERIFKRIAFAKVSGLSLNKKLHSEELAETITLELIRGGHLENDKVPRESIPLVSQSLKKYLFFLENAPFSKIKTRNNFVNFIIDVAACEIEEILANPIKEYVLIDTMCNSMSKRINILPESAMSNEEKNRQIFIATCRTLYDFDDSFIAYRLLDYSFHNWKNTPEKKLPEMANEVVKFYKNKNIILENSNSKDFSQICDRVDTVFSILDDYITENENSNELMSQIEDKNKFRKIIGKIYDKRYKTLRRRLFRLGIFSTLSVFISNWFTFFIVEVPLAQLFYEKFSLFTAFIDFIVPTIVMFVLVIIIRPPRKENRKKVLDAIESFVYKDKKVDLYEIRTGQKSSFTQKSLFATVYLFMIWLVFTLIATAFYVAGLPLTSVVFDTFTIALTVFAAVVIREKSKELNVDNKTNIFEFVLDMVSVPVAKVGSIFARKWREYNVFALLLNFVVETPFVVVLNTLEAWSKFLKDQKAEIR